MWYSPLAETFQTFIQARPQFAPRLLTELDDRPDWIPVSVLTADRTPWLEEFFARLDAVLRMGAASGGSIVVRKLYLWGGIYTLVPHYADEPEQFMKSKVLMVQGTMSSVGKSLLVAALCRIFSDDGLRVAPFKAQNMALNAYATLDGREVGRAQAMQAEAAGIEVTVEMNPVLIKPEADSFAHIIVLGKPWARLPAREYMRRRGELWQAVTQSLDSLRAEYDLVIIEGAGSPVELNLKRGDLVNMAIADYADAPVLLVGDIDRGGIFAQLLGTLDLLEPSERARVKGLIANKFRGDARLFEDGVKMLEERGGIPVLGVIPYVPDLRIADEDSVALDALNQRVATADELDIAVIRLPHISNFDDFDPLRAEPQVVVRFVGRPDELGQPDLIILPGTKTTIADLEFLRECGLADRIIELARGGTAILGICGGYQMLGQRIDDPLHVESERASIAGLCLIPVETRFEGDKRTVRAAGQILANQGLFSGTRGMDITGYEIHMGRTLLSEERVPGKDTTLLSVTRRGNSPTQDLDGLVTHGGWMAGTYFHGLFDNSKLRHQVLLNLAKQKRVHWQPSPAGFSRTKEYARLAQAVRAHIDLPILYKLLREELSN